MKKSIAFTSVLALLPTIAFAQTTQQSDISDIRPAKVETSSTIRTVSLITGDKVEVSTAPDGKMSLNIQPAPGREGIGFYESVTEGKDGEENATVLPMDAAPLVDSNVLDERLFDIDLLLKSGYSNDKSDTLPLIVSYNDEASALKADAPNELDVSRQLPSLHGFSATVDHDDTAKLWKQLTDGPGDKTLDDGISKVWLDGKVKVQDLESDNTIGAPAAWEAGYTGKGATIAVLDTGIDSNHPDLADRIIEKKDFTGTSTEVKDDVGHGTHVAGIIAGTGAASDGKYRGVAPDTNLLIGKVCTPSGCEESAIVGGMEWAASKHPAAINMSLGGSPTDGTSPISQVVNKLTKETGTLFVISAGNSGAPFTVANPGDADAALTVASSTKADALSSFSSRGPRVGDFAVKPDIIAPGSAIIAPRAAGTSAGSPIDSNYTSLNGTSMAAPHVAGAVAILSQEHPDWTASQFKSVLMSSAKPLTGLSVYEQGAGRLDLAHATKTTIYSTTGSVSAGYTFPYSPQKVTRTVTYRNDSSTDVTLTLKPTVVSPDGNTPPEGLFTFSKNELTVPANGTASMEVTIDPAKLDKQRKQGAYSGHLIAISGDISISTAIGAYFEPEGYDLTVQTIGRDGNAPTSVRGMAYNTETGEIISLSFVPGGTATQHLAPGRYDIDTYIEQVDSKTKHAQATLASQPDVIVSKDSPRILTLDARKAKPINVTVDKEDAARVHAELFQKSALFNDIKDPNSQVSAVGQAYVVSSGADTELFATPTAKVADPEHHFYQYAFRPTLVAKSAIGKSPQTAPGYFYDLLFHNEGSIPANLEYEVHDKDLAQVHTKYHDQGKVRRFFRTSQSVLAFRGGGLGNKQQFVDNAPVMDRVEYYTPGDDITYLDQIVLDVGTGSQTSQGVGFSATKFNKKGKYEVEWNRAPVNLSKVWQLGDPSLSRRTGDTVVVQHRPFSFGEEGHELTSHLGAGGTTFKGTTTVSRTGGLSGTVDNPNGVTFIGPAEDSEYTVTTTASRSVPWTDLGTKTELSWTFHSKRPAEGETVTLPLLLIHMDGNFQDYTQVAPAGKLFLLNLSVDHEDGSKVKLNKLTAEISYDDGATWKEQPVNYTSDKGILLMNHPKGSGFVSLRLKAEDKSGNKVSQTIIRAYRFAE
ncbi:S8 family serine peptidase [Gottfriedia sp. NPDC057991]|uniref:S8 family peptidase n=1 Tax=Gottfriedia sp. NPDC057991 TaxID=3346298 RepID=UPI0036D75DE2